jgi:hypothetical protein
MRQQPASLRRQMPEILENAEEKLSTRMRRLLDFLWQEWKHLQLQIEGLNEDVEQIANQDEACARLQQIPGVGPLVATAVVSAMATELPFTRDESLPPGWGWYRDNGRREARPSYWESASGGIHICARSSSCARRPLFEGENRKAAVIVIVCLPFTLTRNTFSTS